MDIGNKITNITCAKSYIIYIYMCVYANLAMCVFDIYYKHQSLNQSNNTNTTLN